MNFREAGVAAPGPPEGLRRGSRKWENAAGPPGWVEASWLDPRQEEGVGKSR